MNETRKKKIKPLPQCSHGDYVSFVCKALGNYIWPMVSISESLQLVLLLWKWKWDSLSHVWLCDPMDCSMLGLPVHHQLLEFIQPHVHWVGDANQPSHPLSSSSLPALNTSQHQCLFKWVSSSHQVAKVLEFHLQHQSFQWTFRTDFF